MPSAFITRPKGDTRKAYRLELVCTFRRAREEMARWAHSRRVEFATSEHASLRSYTPQFDSWSRAGLTAARLHL